MSRSSDPGHFFQTTSSLESSARKAAKSTNTFGNPIKLPSKLLAVIPDPLAEDGIYVAESAGTVKRISLSKREVTHIFVGPAAPVSCICIHVQKEGNQGGIKATLFAGCWDKLIWSWTVPPLSSLAQPLNVKSDYQLHGHIDFVKALTVLSLPSLSTPILISGDAKSEILFFDLKSRARLHVLKGAARGILDLKFDPSTLYHGTRNAILYCADSSRDIRTCAIPIPFDPSSPTTPTAITSSILKSLTLSPPLLIHETSVYALHFSSTGTDLYTASADKTAKHLTRHFREEENDEENEVSATLSPSDIWDTTSPLTLPHPDFVRCINASAQYIVTGCRDEEIRLFNSATGKLEHTYTGHHEEVTGVCIRGLDTVSVSIDGTVRTWSLQPAGIEEWQKEFEKWRDGKEDDEEGKGHGVGESMLTEEEERELAELMAETDE